MNKVLLFLFLAICTCNSFAQISISDARQLNEGSSVTISGIVTNGDELGVIRYIQDATAGIGIYDNDLTTLKRGDSITVTGILDEYSNLLEITDVSNFTIHSSNNILPEARIITPNQIGEQYEGQLIRINNIELEGSASTFAGNKNYDFIAGNYSGIIRINSGSPLVGTTIPFGEFNLVAICSQYSTSNNDTQSGYQLLPRDMGDILSGSSINITSPVKITEITKSSLQLSWTTDTGGFPFVRYGYTHNESSLTNIVTGDVATYEENNINIANIVGLQPAQVIYAQAFSTNETDTSFSSIAAYSTESNSTGEIMVYFNSAVDETHATETIAHDIGNAMEDTLAAYIARATESIDFSLYNFNNSTISAALNNAADRGIRIRVITCGSTAHYSIDDLNSAIQVLERPVIDNSGIMHNKFAIFDANRTNPEKPWVWSGSTNLTQDQLYSDANNMIFIQDQSLAKAYEIEFEEMWGSSGDSPNNSLARFGTNKKDNTPHEFSIGGNRVQLYFSPSDNTNQKLIDAINSSHNDLCVETMLITRSDLGNAIVGAYVRDVKVYVITNNDKDNSEAVNKLLNETLPSSSFVFDNHASGMLHNKVAIIDAGDAGSDPQVVTGSHNWSNSANDKNDENTLIIHNADIANQYFQQFAKRFDQNQGSLVVSVQETPEQSLRLYPNPTEGTINLSSRTPIRCLKLYSISGAKAGEWELANQLQSQIVLPAYLTGVYILKIELTNGKTNSYKVVKR